MNQRGAFGIHGIIGGNSKSTHMRILIFGLIVISFAGCGRQQKETPPWAKSQSNWTDLMKWSYVGDTARIDSALRSGMDPDETNHTGWTPLKVAVKAGKTSVVRLLLRSNADPNLADGVKMTPLMEACLSNNYDIAKVLIEHGADVNATLDNGWTALMGATSYGGIELMQLLIDNKANVNAIRTTDNFTVLSIAQYHKAEDKIRLLKKFGGR